MPGEVDRQHGLSEGEGGGVPGVGVQTRTVQQHDPRPLRAEAHRAERASIRQIEPEALRGGDGRSQVGGLTRQIGELIARVIRHGGGGSLGHEGGFRSEEGDAGCAARVPLCRRFGDTGKSRIDVRKCAAEI
ncbi:hypothetical protein GCM10009746_25830 [Microbacterium paludicola]